MTLVMHLQDALDVFVGDGVAVAPQLRFQHDIHGQLCTLALRT